ncbi:MAG: hypothetical protein R2737_06250 [Candidatus Nanopelagicales bacterium]
MGDEKQAAEQAATQSAEGADQVEDIEVPEDQAEDVAGGAPRFRPGKGLRDSL